MNPQARIADIAEQFLNKTEITPNKAPWIRQLWLATNYKDGMENAEPYCSAFATFCVKTADAQTDLINLRHPPYFPAVAQWLPWAQDPSNGCTVFKYNRQSKVYIPQRGDIVIFQPHFSHVGIVSGTPFTSQSTGELYVPTYEANTKDGEGGNQRDGDGVFARKRSTTICGSFIRLPTVAQRA